MIKVVGIITNLDRDIGLISTKKLVSVLEKNGIRFLMHERMKGKMEGVEFFSFQSPCGIEAVVCIGGDGTVLGLKNLCIENNLPIIGINKGRLGFLNEIEPDEIESIIDILSGKSCYVDSRGLLEVRAGDKTYYALNEALMYRDYESKIIILDVKVEGQLVDRYSCDGFIVSTPTGSTAYSLSAGGPILSPNTRANVLTPLNSHTLRSKPIVVCNEDKVVLTLARPERGARIILDGDVVCSVKAGEPIEICGSKLSMKFLRRTNDFYSKLLYKLNILGTTDGF